MALRKYPNFNPTLSLIWAVQSAILQNRPEGLVKHGHSVPSCGLYQAARRIYHASVIQLQYTDGHLYRRREHNKTCLQVHKAWLPLAEPLTKTASYQTNSTVELICPLRSGVGERLTPAR